MENLEQLKLGLIGISDGNGHPYSWSAIFNGYDNEHMSRCPYPNIYDYLRKQSFPQDAIDGALVTHVWTQSKEQSIKIAKASNIPYIVDHYEDMIGNVDAVLIARDDAENHFNFAKKFLQAGVPIYIDKPLATSCYNARQLLELQKYDWQIFSCTALRYAKEFHVTDDILKAVGDIKYIAGVVPKSWDKYAIHVIEPIILITGIDIMEHSVIKKNGITQLSFVSSSGIVVNVTSFGNIPSDIAIKINGTKGMRELVFSDSFNAFKKSLEVFIATIRDRRVKISRDETLAVIKLIELGN